MIPMKYKGSDLIGKKCRPTHNIRNGAGDGITSKTVCKIVDVVRGHGFTIQTETCPHCGQYAYIRKVKREELELVDGNTAATLSGWISVEDRLPPPNENVLYYEKGSEIDVMPSEWIREQYYEGYYKIYWMPLPEPPKECEG